MHFRSLFLAALLPGLALFSTACFNADLTWQSTSSTLGGTGSAGPGGAPAAPPPVSISGALTQVVPVTSLASYPIAGTCQGATSVQLSGASTASVPCVSGAWSTTVNLNAPPSGSYPHDRDAWYLLPRAALRPATVHADQGHAAALSVPVLEAVAAAASRPPRP